jgi:hypothetical protein
MYILRSSPLELGALRALPQIVLLAWSSTARDIEAAHVIRETVIPIIMEELCLERYWGTVVA